MSVSYSLGSVARFYFSVIAGGAGQAGLSPTTAIQRVADGSWFQAIDNSWVPTIVENPMVQVDVANFPGLYAFDFDQSLDTLQGSQRYLVKQSEGTTPVLSYEEKVFGPIGSTTDPALCSVTGTVYDGMGEPKENVLVRAILEPVFKDNLGRAYSDRTVATYTNALGDFDLPLVRNATFRLEIADVGYDRKVVIPDQASVVFTDL